MTMTKRIAIIGSAGRREDAPRVTRKLFDAMVERAVFLLGLGGTVGRANLDAPAALAPNGEPIVLVSGGAAFADHVAVELHKRYPKRTTLELWLPCPWDPQNRQFLDTGVFDWRTNPGGTAVALHRQFSRVCGFDSLEELHQLIGPPSSSRVSVHVGRGFHDRNLYVADSDALVAFTFGEGDAPKDGGTAHTWRASRASVKIHVPLATLVLQGP